MRIKMKRSVTLASRGGGTETYAAGREYNVDADTAHLLGEAAAIVDQDEPEPRRSRTFEIKPPPPVLEALDETTDPEE